MWKQIIGDELTLADIKEVDVSTYAKLHDHFEGDTVNSRAEVQKYFSKYNYQTSAIRSGMDAVLAGKLDVIAYLPVAIIRDRICGSKSYTAEFLRSNTKYTYHGEETEEFLDK